MPWSRSCPLSGRAREFLRPMPEVMRIFLWLFTALSSFVLLNLVTAVIVQQAMDMSKGDEQESGPTS